MVSVYDSGPIEESGPKLPVLVATENYEVRVAETQSELEAAQQSELGAGRGGTGAL